MTALSKDAHDFVDGIVQNLKRKKNFTRAFPKVRKFLEKIQADAYAESSVHITTAIPLTDEEKQDIEQYFFTKAGNSVHPHYTIDQDILGGMCIQQADWIVDSTIKDQLSVMQKILKE